VLLSRAKGNAAAQALLAYLRSAEAKALIQGYGYR
jgi:ABC-type molybdate transport system substrate-binding protein